MSNLQHFFLSFFFSPFHSRRHGQGLPRRLGHAGDGVLVGGGRVGRLAVQDDLGLLEVPPGVLVYQHQAQVVPRRELLVDVAERRRQVEAAEEEADRDGLAARGGPVHDLFVFGEFVS